MMKYILFFLFIIALINCSQRATDCKILIKDYAVYDGYGVVKFSYSRTGAIRYIEFYPICVDNIENIETENITNLNFGEGIIIRENISSEIWRALIKDKRIFKDDEEYGKALVYLKFNLKIDKDKVVKKFKNYISLFDKNFNLTIVDIGLYNIAVQEFKLVKGIE